MIRNPKDLTRYDAHERANHWLVGICFILLALSGPGLFPSGLLSTDTALRRRGLGAHPAPLPRRPHGAGLPGDVLPLQVAQRDDGGGQGMAVAAGEMVSGDDHNMPEQGKYNGGQKAMFWVMTLCMLLLFVSGVFLWRAYFNLPVDVVRLGAVVHSAIAAIMIAMTFVHVYAALWVRGTVRAMVYGTVTRALGQAAPSGVVSSGDRQVVSAACYHLVNLISAGFGPRFFFR
jgi:formate dehydrogenase subunit gamma